MDLFNLLFGILGTLAVVVSGKDRGNGSDSLGDYFVSMNEKYGEKALSVVQNEQSIDERFPSYIKELSRKNKTEAKELNEIYLDLKSELEENKEASHSWDIVAKNKAQNMEEMIEAGYRLDAILGEDMRKGELSQNVRNKRGFRRWWKRNWRKIVRVVIQIISQYINN